ncbi:MAG: transposase [Rhizobiales bacterium]|nr:transposase [Hyphomicrobiales bacterium]
MVRYRRNFVAGGTYFFTATLVDRTSHALVDHIDALRASFRATRQAHPFTVDAIVVLPDHLHVVMTLPQGDADYPTRWQLIKRRFTAAVAKAGVSIPRHSNGEHALWQRRFWEHTIRDDRDFERHVDYIHINPVKHSLVTRVRDWPHSSFHRYVRNGLLPEDWAGDVRTEQANFGERRG